MRPDAVSPRKFVSVVSLSFIPESRSNNGYLGQKNKKIDERRKQMKVMIKKEKEENNQERSAKCVFSRFSAFI